MVAYVSLNLSAKYVFFVNGSKWFRSKLHILKLAPSCTKLPKSGRKVSPEWPKNRPLARTPNGVKSLKFIVKMWVFCKLNRDGCSLRPKWHQSGPKVTQSHPHILKVSPKLPTSAPKAAPNWLYGCIFFFYSSAKYVFFVNWIETVAHFGQSDTEVSPRWPKATLIYSK